MFKVTEYGLNDKINVRFFVKARINLKSHNIVKLLCRKMVIVGGYGVSP